MLEVINLSFEQMGYQEALNDATRTIAQLNEQIQPLMNSIEGLESQIANTEDEDQRQSYEQERNNLVSQASPLLQERNRLEAIIDPLNVSIAAVGGMLAAYDITSPCVHEAQCPQCGFLLASCICNLVTCNICNHLITQCTCNDATSCPYCGFDSRYCGCSNPFDP